MHGWERQCELAGNTLVLRDSQHEYVFTPRRRPGGGFAAPARRVPGMSEAITQTCPGPQDPVESFAEPQDTLGPDRHSIRDVPLPSDSPVQEPDRLRPVDPKRRIVDIDMRQLQPCAAAGDEVGASVRCGPEQQTRRERGLREVVMVAAEDVAEAGHMDIPLDHETRRQEEADATPEQRRIPLLGVSVAD